MVIRTAKIADASQIAQVHVETWCTAYRGLISDAVLEAHTLERRTLFWQRHLAEKQVTVFVAEDDGLVVGFCDLIPTRDKDADPRAVAEIVAIYVLPGYWRKGAGRALCDRALTEARRQGYTSITLWALASNSEARRFYEAMGFSLDGTVKTERASDGSILHEVRFRKVI
jgi:ribosomal protein S18 acetylase RimI-like enzyme